MAEIIYPGPFCQEQDITQDDLSRRKISCTEKLQPPSNGLVLEINQYLDKTGGTSNDLFEIILQLDPSFQKTTGKYVKNKVTRLSEQKRKLVSKKKVPGFKNVKELLNSTFQAPVSRSDILDKDNNLNIDTEKSSTRPQSIDQQSFKDPILNISVQKKTCTSVAIQTQFENDSDCDLENADKFTNLAKYRNSMLGKYSQKLEKKIEEQKNAFSEVASRIGHYSVRNVNKRDETAKKNLHSLRDSQRQTVKLERQVKELKEKVCDAENKIQTLKKSSECLSEEMVMLKETRTDLDKKLKTESAKKVIMQKTISYYKKETHTLRSKFKDTSAQEGDEKDKQCTICEDLGSKMTQKEQIISELEDKVENLQIEAQSEKPQTKNDKKCFNDKVRLCVVDLSGLEVAVDKVPEVIRTVAKQLFNKEFGKNELPTSTTVQSIIDEGHFIAKTFISEKMLKAENWGLNRDGTTRRKKKILDTAITLNSGEVMSLGYNRVAHETAVSINEVTKSHINELASLNTTLAASDNKREPDSELYIKQSLEKLAYTMSDRASNEKKASVLLNEWRDEVLGEETAQHEKVNSFHCMAHVLLGFHTYICKDMKEHEKLISAENGPLGRDSLSCFKFWSKKKTVIERVLRTTSNVFGPSGDHHGVRDMWEAHCAANGIKSVIGNYKDNRFNGLFQTAAEIYLHRDDFIKVLQMISSPNLLLKSVMADLQSETVMTLVQAMGLLYINLTGPYWNLVVGNKVPYLKLHSEVAEIMIFLGEIDNEPETLLKSKHWSNTDPYEVSHVPYKHALSKKLSVVSDNNEDLLFETLRLSAKSIQRTIEKQLVDFLPDGKFSSEPTETDLKRTGFAHLTNLGCEHHFGSLDSSQRRRPRASLHHHSSIQLIKQNRTGMMNWLMEMPETERSCLLKSARKGGKELREKHQKEDKSILSTITSEMESKKTNKKRKAETPITNKQKRQVPCNESESDSFSDGEEEAKLLEELPSTSDICANVYVAVAYQDSWYPGVVKETIGQDKSRVRFMTHAHKPGVFKWPTRDDIQTVENRFILVSGFIPDCVGSGRMWAIEKHATIDNVYRRYSRQYFE